MPSEFVPSREDYESVDRAVAHMRDRGWRVTGINEVVDAWSQLVEQVERGYDDEPSEFINDLSCRTAIAEMIPFLTVDVSANLEDRVQALDRRFIAATDGPNEGPDGVDRWWMARRLRAASPADE